MAIDVIARSGTRPLIVGDIEDMEGFIEIAFEGTPPKPCIMLEREDNLHSVPLGKDVGEVFSHTDSAIVVAINEDDEIVMSYIVPVGNSDQPIRNLTEEDLKGLTEAIVEQDFAVDFLR